jgi:hypothetical protein
MFTVEYTEALLEETVHKNENINLLQQQKKEHRFTSHFSKFKSALKFRA